MILCIAVKIKEKVLSAYTTLPPKTATIQFKLLNIDHSYIQGWHANI